MDCVREQTRSRRAFHRDVYLFERVTGTEELDEALRKDGFQPLFVAQSEAREVFFLRVDTSLLCAACWTMTSGMRLANHVKFQQEERSESSTGVVRLRRRLEPLVDSFFSRKEP